MFKIGENIMPENNKSSWLAPVAGVCLIVLIIFFAGNLGFYFALGLVMAAIVFVVLVSVFGAAGKLTSLSAVKAKLLNDRIEISGRAFPLTRIYSVYADQGTIYVCMSESEDKNVVRGMVKDPKHFGNVFSQKIGNSKELLKHLQGLNFSQSIDKFHADIYSEIGDAHKELIRLRNNN